MIGTYRGKVKWFSPEKGYGFISCEKAEEVFVHYTEIVGGGFRILHDGEEVEFDLHDTMRGYQARNVRRLGMKNDIGSPRASEEPSRRSRS